MENLKIYELCRQVPQEAKKTIQAGRLKGMTDINPMWRIKKLTELFGACGVGWYVEIVDKWTEPLMASDEVSTYVRIKLYIRENGEWSKPIEGIGGSMILASQKGALYTNDEAYKMAYTDALSVACKMLGIGADVYWEKDNTKYSDSKKDNTTPKTESTRDKVLSLAAKLGITPKELAQDYGLDGHTTEERFKEVLKDLEGK